jgi:Derlin-2/3
MIYLWSKANSKQMVSILGLINMRAGYLPYFYLFWSLLRTESLFFDVLGVLIGHVLYYIYFIVPELPFTRGINILAAPKPIKYLTQILQLDSNRELELDAGDFIEDDNFIPNLR